MTVPEAPLRVSSWRRWLDSALPWILVFFCATFVLTVQNNRSPYYYEKDAESKVEQVLSGERNFFHPLLMLNATDLAMRVTGTPRTKEAAVVAGRTCLAVFTAVAVAAFAALGFRWAGHPGALCGGALVMSQALVFELGHYMKEDPALLMGLALSFLAMQWFWEKRTTHSAGWLGAACGLALSGKYVGIAAPIIAIVLLVLARRDGQDARARWIIFFAAFLGVTAVINWQILVELNQFSTGFGSEMHRQTGRAEKVMQIPHVTQTLGVFRDNVPKQLAWLALVPIGIAWVRRDRSRPVVTAIAVYAIVFLGVLMYSPRLFTRHFLPVVAAAVFLAGIAIAQLVPLLFQLLRLQRHRVLGLVLTVAALAGIYFQCHHRRFVATYQAFSKPTREQLIAQLNKKVPRDAVIAADERLYLRDPEGRVRDDAPVPQQVIVRQQLGDFQTIDELVRQGVTYVAAHRVSSEPLFLPEPSSKGDKGDTTHQALRKRHQNTKGFYAEIQQYGELVWEVPSGESGYTTPGIRLYRLRLEKIKSREQVASVDSNRSFAEGP